MCEGFIASEQPQMNSPVLLLLVLQLLKNLAINIHPLSENDDWMCSRFKNLKMWFGV